MLITENRLLQTCIFLSFFFLSEFCFLSEKNPAITSHDLHQVTYQGWWTYCSRMLELLNNHEVRGLVDLGFFFALNQSDRHFSEKGHNSNFIKPYDSKDSKNNIHFKLYLKLCLIRFTMLGLTNSWWFWVQKNMYLRTSLAK